MPRGMLYAPISLVCICVELTILYPTIGDGASAIVPRQLLARVRSEARIRSSATSALLAYRDALIHAALLPDNPFKWLIALFKEMRLAV
jgi:hypothetical protein